MTKQELKKAINDGESVWYLSDIFDEPVEIKIKEHTDKFMDRLDFYCYTDKNGEKREHHIDRLFKTEAEAKHYLHHARVKRVERLPFLTWEEFKSGKDFNFTGKDNHEYLFSRTYDTIILFIINCNEILVSYDLTEENFYKAYDECVRLFKGEWLDSKML